MAMSYNVKFWEIRERTDRRKPYQVRWTVNGREKSESFIAKGLADSRRSDLMSSARRGEPFDDDSGLPASELRARQQSITWYQHAHNYIDHKWDRTPGASRKTIADSMATITAALSKTDVGKPDLRVLRRALYSWAYNKNAWKTEPPGEWRRALDWAERHSLPMGELEDPVVLRHVLDALTLKLDGSQASSKTIRRKRAQFSDALGYAAEHGYFTIGVNPLASVKWKAPRSTDELDPESVPNPTQITALLEGVRQQGKRGEQLEAFFGALYYAAMRPGEAIRLQESQCFLPAEGWGTLTLRGGIVLAGKAWTDDGEAHEDHALKHRARQATRPVPIPPVYVTMLRAHINRHGTAPDGRVFQSGVGKYVQASAYGKTWRAARENALSPQERSSQLAKRPYDLRHAGISFWLSSGVDPAECARRAGHSLAVMFRIYAKVLSQGEDRANRRIDKAMEEWKQKGGRDVASEEWE